MAANLPQELFGVVIHFIRGGKSARFADEKWRDEQPLKLSKRELGTCAVVCRYWATHIRPHMFRQLTLRSRDDAVALIAFAQSEFWPANSGFNMGAYVEALAFEQDIHALPWIHLILHCIPRSLLPRLSPEEFDTGVTVFTAASGKENEDQQLAPRSIYDGLPRRFPMLSSVQPSIHLKDMTFQHFKDILPLVSQIPAASVRCQSLRWLDAETLDTPMSPPRSTRGKRLVPHIIEVCDNVVAWPFIWMLVTTNMPQRVSRSAEGNRPIYIVPSELCTMAALIKCLFDECGCIICTSRGVTARQRRKDFTMWPLGSRPSFKNAGVVLQNSIELVRESASHQLSFQISEHGFVTHLELMLYDESKEGYFSRPPDELKIDWDAIDTLASQLAAPNPPQLDIRVDTNSVADMRVVAPYLRAQMPRLQSAGRLIMTSQQRYVWTTWKQELEKVEDGSKPVVSTQTQMSDANTTATNPQ